MAAFDWWALTPVGALLAGIVTGAVITLRLAKMVASFLVGLAAGNARTRTTRRITSRRKSGAQRDRPCAAGDHGVPHRRHGDTFDVEAEAFGAVDDGADPGEAVDVVD